ncbi:hypothetical protein IM511_08025 [Erythrobacteraceae bacterium E2-1 Yellow Sea]|nr:hypothetical protein [Erythrobacteraceae bacterium E2-1 Yellow Sea]
MNFDIEGHSEPAPPRQVTPYRQAHVRIGRKHTVGFSFCDGALRTYWWPSVPTARAKKKLLPAYIRARDAFLAKAAKATSMTVAVPISDRSLKVFEGKRR